MAVKIAIANQKGGVGKTTTALAIASNLISRGYKVLMIDTDSQRNTSNVYKAETIDVPTLYDIIFANYDPNEVIQTTEYGDIIPSDVALQNADTEIKPSPKMYRYLQKAVAKIEGKYDFIIYDTPPKAGVLLGNVLMDAQWVICPITCDTFGVQGIMDFYSTVAEYQEDNEDLRILGLLKVMYKSNQNLTRDIEEHTLPKYASDMHSKVFKSAIRESVKVKEAQTLGKPLFEYAPHSNAGLDYDALVDEILEEVM
jgi:chromosome partitioning protein